MTKIINYINRFAKAKGFNRYYDMSLHDWCVITQMAHSDSGNAFDATSTAFCYGYAKGYRAALAEAKTGQDIR